MKNSLAIAISLVTVIVGLIFGKPSIWLPISFLVASIIELPTRAWVNSDKLGSMRNLSFMTKTLFAYVGMYASIGQVICAVILFKWFI